MKKILLIFILLVSVQITGFAQKHKKTTVPTLSEESITATNKIITDFTSHLNQNVYGKKWSKVKDDWTKKLGLANTAEGFGKAIQMLAKNINNDTYKDSWDGIRSSWQDKAEKVKSLKQIGTLLKQLESHLKPTAYDEAWAPMRDAWIASLATLK